MTIYTYAWIEGSAAYQLVWEPSEAGMKEYRRALENRVTIGESDRLVIGDITIRIQ